MAKYNKHIVQIVNVMLDDKRLEINSKSGDNMMNLCCRMYLMVTVIYKTFI